MWTRQHPLCTHEACHLRAAGVSPRCGRGRGAPELAPKPQVCTGKRTSTPRAVTTNFRNPTGGQSETIFEVYEKFSSLLPSLGSVSTEVDQVGPRAAKVQLSPQGARGWGRGVTWGPPGTTCPTPQPKSDSRPRELGGRGQRAGGGQSERRSQAGIFVRSGPQGTRPQAC